MKLAYRGWRIFNPRNQFNYPPDTVSRIPGPHPVLLSPFRDTVWPRDGLVAECPGAPTSEQQELSVINILTEHMERCTCGIYALKTVQDVSQQYSSDIIGEALLYGDIIEGDRGFRASKCKVGTLFLPDELNKPDELFQMVADYYEVPLIKGPSYSSDLLREPFVLDDRMLKHITNLQTSTGFDPLPRQTWSIEMIFEPRNMPKFNPKDKVTINLNACGVHLDGEAVITRIEHTANLGGAIRVTVELQSTFADRVSSPNCRCVMLPPVS